MIRKLLERVFSGRSAKGGPKVIAFEQHGIARERLSPCARKVVLGLQEAGYAAFVVGGAVRDLLVDLEPKDFDVATSATPEEVKAVFRRSRIIGRRFRLVHVLCGQDTVEVSTFRGSASGEDDDQVRDEHGRILRDNVFGSQAEDAIRRDFTVNALFYDPATQQILDYCGGFADLRKRVIRMIGKAEERYREDPVRMLRAVRLAAKVGGHIEPRSRAPIRTLATLMQNVPPSRLFEEMLKLLLSGHATECLLQLRSEGLAHGLLPLLDVILEQPMGERFVMLALTKTDERVREDKPVSPAFLFAALLWHEVLAAWKKLEGDGHEAGPGAAAGDGRRHRRAGGEARHPAPLHHRHEGDLGLAAAPAQPCRAPALQAPRAPAAARRIRLPGAARRKRRGGSRGRWTGGRGFSRPARTSAHACCCPTRAAASAGAAGAARRPASQGDEPAPADDAVSAT